MLTSHGPSRIQVHLRLGCTKVMCLADVNAQRLSLSSNIHFVDALLVLMRKHTVLWLHVQPEHHRDISVLHYLFWLVFCPLPWTEITLRLTPAPPTTSNLFCTSPILVFDQ